MNKDLNDIPEIQLVLNSQNFHFDRRGKNNDLNSINPNKKRNRSSKN